MWRILRISSVSKVHFSWPHCCHGFMMHSKSMAGNAVPDWWHHILNHPWYPRAQHDTAESEVGRWIYPIFHSFPIIIKIRLFIIRGRQINVRKLLRGEFWESSVAMQYGILEGWGFNLCSMVKVAIARGVCFPPGWRMTRNKITWLAKAALVTLGGYLRLTAAFVEEKPSHDPNERASNGSQESHRPVRQLELLPPWTPTVGLWN